MKERPTRSAAAAANACIVKPVSAGTTAAPVPSAEKRTALGKSKSATPNSSGRNEQHLLSADAQSDLDMLIEKSPATVAPDFRETRSQRSAPLVDGRSSRSPHLSASSKAQSSSSSTLSTATVNIKKTGTHDDASSKSDLDILIDSSPQKPGLPQLWNLDVLCIVLIYHLF